MCAQVHPESTKAEPHPSLPPSQDSFPYYRSSSFPLTLSFSPLPHSSLPHAYSGAGDFTDERDCKTDIISPRLNSFIALHPSAPSCIPLRSPTSATRPFPAVWDYFLVCGKENSSASNSMPFLDSNKLAAKEMQANTINLQGTCHSWIISPLILVSFFIIIANKLYVDSKLRLHHSFFSEPFASPQDLPS